MEEQPSNEPSRERPVAPSGRQRGTKAAFAAPEPDRSPEPPAPRSRPSKAPPVLFQPPAEHEPPPVRPPAGSPAADADADADATRPASGADPGSEAPAQPPRVRRGRAVEQAATPASAEHAEQAPPKQEEGQAAAPSVAAPAKATPQKAATRKAATRKAVAEKATPKKATPKKAATKAVPKKAADTVTEAATSPEAATTHTPAKPTTRSTMINQSEPDGAPAPSRPTGDALASVLPRIVERPDRLPELLALAAVDVLGPPAADWARRFRESYPSASADGLAKLATRHYVRLATAGGAVSATAGLFAPLLGFAVLLWTRAGLVLHLAAAHGLDPADRERVVDLLVLTGIHGDESGARQALAAADDGQSTHRLTDVGTRLGGPLAVQAGGWLALRFASRLLPGAAPLVAGAAGSAATEQLAARAAAHYRQRRVQSQSNQSRGSSA
nr:hypothetical protein [Micromonospora sp. DSM 115978]